MHTGDIEFRVLHFDQLESSNIHAQALIKQGEIKHGDVILTDYQQQGKGQLSTKWDSEANENLLFSLYLQLSWPADRLFQLSKMASLAVYDLLDNLAVPELKIKWPNDILLNSKKICGILIENSIQANRAIHTVIGIGLNVNQLTFPEFDRQATSLKETLGREFDRDQLLKQLLNCFSVRLNQFAHHQESLDRGYQEVLFGRDRKLEFESEGNTFKAVLKGVDQYGRLMLEKAGERLFFDLKEIRFLD
jgi:BirA family biotin operon repressor/biotin-[acetyl-CoA-carboxylase] ligase